MRLHRFDGEIHRWSTGIPWVTPRASFLQAMAEAATGVTLVTTDGPAGRSA